MAIGRAGLGRFGCCIVQEISTLPHHLYEFTATKLEVNRRVLLQHVWVEGVGEFDGFVDIAVEDGGADL